MTQDKLTSSAPEGIAAARVELAEAGAAPHDANRLQADLAEAHFNLGNALIMVAAAAVPTSSKAAGARGNQDAAVERCWEAVRLRPDLGPAWYDLACAHALAGDIGQAAEGLRRAIALDASLRESARREPNLRRVCLCLGMGRSFTHQDAGGSLVSLPGAESPPGGSLGPAWYYLAYTHALAGNTVQAAEGLRRAIALDAGFRDSARREPNLRRARLCLGMGWSFGDRDAGGSRPGAESPPDGGQRRPGPDARLTNAAFQAITSRDWRFRDRMATQEGLPLVKQESLVGTVTESAVAAPAYLEEAIAAYREAVRLRPDFLPAHRHLLSALRGQGDVRGAQESCRSILTIAPGDVEVLRVLEELADGEADLLQTKAASLAADGNVDGAVAAYREVIRLRPNRAETRSSLGGLLVARRDFAGAVSECREAVRLRPDLAEAHFNLGDALSGLAAAAASASLRMSKPEAASEPATGAVTERPKVLMFYCRCGQRVKITFPTTKNAGRCPRCAHSFDFPSLPED